MGRPTREPPLDRPPEADADPVEVGKQIILRLLSHSPRTRHELAQALAKREVPPQAAEQALDRIAELGYIDDAAFARSWVESRHRARGLSERVLRRELVQRGVAAETIDEAIDDFVDRDSELAAARAFVEKKLRSMSTVDQAAATRRLVGMLGRRGYPPGMASGVVREALASCYAERAL